MSPMLSTRQLLHEALETLGSNQPGHPETLWLTEDWTATTMRERDLDELEQPVRGDGLHQL